MGDLKQGRWIHQLWIQNCELIWGMNPNSQGLIDLVWWLLNKNYVFNTFYYRSRLPIFLVFTFFFHHGSLIYVSVLFVKGFAPHPQTPQVTKLLLVSHNKLPTSFQLFCRRISKSGAWTWMSWKLLLELKAIHPSHTPEPLYHYAFFNLFGIYFHKMSME